MYDPWIFELDLCILSYQLHSQTLIWPMDPYYEQYKNERRKKFLEAVYKAQGCRNFNKITDGAQITTWRRRLEIIDTSNHGGQASLVQTDTKISGYCIMLPKR